MMFASLPTKILTKLLLISFLAFITVGPSLATSMPGGYIDAATSDPQVQKIADFAVSQINRGHLVRIISAQTQVVAGVNYALQLELAANDNVHHVYRVVVFVPLPVANLPMQISSVKEIH